MMQGSVFVAGETDTIKGDPNSSVVESLEVVRESSKKAAEVTGNAIKTVADALLADKTVAVQVQQDPNVGMTPSDTVTKDAVATKYETVGIPSFLKGLERGTRKTFSRRIAEIVKRDRVNQSRATATGPYKRPRKLREEDTSELTWIEETTLLFNDMMDKYNAAKQFVRDIKSKALALMRAITKTIRNVQARMREVQRWINEAKAQPSELSRLFDVGAFTREFSKMKKTAMATEALFMDLLESIGLFNGTLDEAASSFSDEDYDRLLDMAIAHGRADAVQSILNKSRDSYVPTHMGKRMLTLSYIMTESKPNNTIYIDILAIPKVNITLYDVVASGTTFTFAYAEGQSKAYNVIDGDAAFKITLQNTTLFNAALGLDKGSQLMAATQAILGRK
jgi:hypothetical protein